jgi:LuxR family transcriptional regulator
MNVEFQIIIEEIIRSSSPSEAWEYVKLATKMLGFDHCAYGQKSVFPTSSHSAAMINTYPKEWNNIYKKERIIEHDPVVNTGMKTTNPILWEDVYSKNQEIWERSNGFGLKYGWSKSSLAPSGMASLFSVCRSHEPLSQSEVKLKLPFLLWLSSVTTQMQAQHHTKDIPTYRLTQRESEVITWSANGKTSSEISLILGLSERTVNWHIKNVVEKLGVTNKTGAVAKSIRLSLI